MEFTQDELTVAIEACREYRLRLPPEPDVRRLLCEVLIYRFGYELIKLATRAESEQ